MNDSAAVDLESQAVPILTDAQPSAHGAVVPDLDIDRLPPPRRGLLLPDGKPPTGWKVRNIKELVGIISRCGILGTWKQGGMEQLGRYEGDDYVVNFYATTSKVLVQGKRANEINTRPLMRGA